MYCLDCSVIDINGDHRPLFGGIFFFIIVTEIIPSFALVILIWSVPQRQAKSVDNVVKGRLGFLRDALWGKDSGSTRNLLNYAEENNQIIISKNSNNSVAARNGGDNGTGDRGGVNEGIYAPLLQGENEVFNDPSRYDSPPSR